MAALESPPNRIEYNEAFNSNRTTLGSYDSYNSSNSLLCVDISISSVEGGASLNASSNTTDEKKKDASVMVHEVLPPYQDILAPDTASLPREQRDWGAIKFMAGSIIIESIIWGFPTLFGVFGRYYTTTSKFSGDTRIAIIGTVSLGVTSIPFIVPFITAYPQHRIKMITAGYLICILSLIGAAYSNTIPRLIVTQGALYGAGFVLIYFNMISIFNEWFLSKRGIAYGVLSAAGGTISLSLPFLIEWALQHYGQKNTLLAYAIAVVILTPITFMLLSTRPADQLPPKPASSPKTKINFALFKTPIFLLLAWSNLFQSLVYFLPTIYLPTYALCLSLSTSQGTLLLVLLNISIIVGQLCIGYVSDHHSLPLPVFLSTLISSIACFGLWYVGRSLPILIVFCLVYGFFAGGYSVFYGRFMTAISDGDLDTGIWLYGFFDLERGIGIVAAGPISAALVQRGKGLYGDTVREYDYLILLVGAGMAVSCLSVVGWKWVDKSTRNKKGSEAISDIDRSTITHEI